MPMGGPFLLMKLLETLGYPNYAKSAEGQASQTPVAFNYKTAKEALNEMRNENLEMRNEKPSHLSPLTSHLSPEVHIRGTIRSSATPLTTKIASQTRPCTVRP